MKILRLEFSPTVTNHKIRKNTSNEIDQKVIAEVNSMHIICYSNEQCCMKHRVLKNGNLLLSCTLYL